MGLRTFMGVAGVLVAFAFAFVGCASDEAQKVQPEARGKRGEACQARNDCESGLACLNQICSKNDFDVSVIPKQCDRVECQDDVDCCGDKPSVAPAKCAKRPSVCETFTIPGCQQGVCASNATCGGGTCSPGSCSLVGGACTSTADCADRCVGNFCSISFQSCTLDSQCTGTSVCQNRVCNCANPEYNPADPICTDPDCVDVCLLRCEGELCIEDRSCKKPADCFNVGLRICSDAGRCVQCNTNDECDAEGNETCVNGQCKKPCEQNEECPLFEACEAGECVHVGCSSDRECVLSARQGPEASTDDARLLKCLPSEANPEIKTCKVPCENDGSCGSQFEVCDAGYCKFVGCDNNEECRGFLGLVGQETTENRPFVPTAVCRE